MVPEEDVDFKETGLKATSTVRLHRLMTVTTSLIEREIGVLSEKLQSQVADKLRTLFELAS